MLSNGEMGAHVDANTLAAFVDQRLDGERRAAVMAHLAECGSCRASLAVLARGLDVPRTRHVPVWLPIAALLAVTTIAGAIVWRTQPPLGEPQEQAPARDVNLPTPAPVPAPPPPTEATPKAAAPPSDDLAVRRGAVRRVGGKTFRLVAGEWVDASYDPLGLLPIEEIAGPAARTALLAKMPELRPYAALGPVVTVVHDGVVYRFRR